MKFFVRAKCAVGRILPRSSFGRSVSVLVGGTAFAQALVVLASPLLTRLYSPADFGLLAIHTALLSTIAVAASLRYELAIPLPENDKDAASVAVLSLIVLTGISLLVATILWVWGRQLAGLLNTPQIYTYFWLLPTGLFFSGIYQVLTNWAVRTSQFSAIAKTKLGQSVAQVGVQLGGHLLGPFALLLGQVVGQAAGNSTLAALAIRRRWPLFRSVSWQDVRAAGVRWRRFPLFDTCAGLTNAAGVQLPSILFAALFTPAAAGVYLLANRVLGMPMLLVGQAIAQVFFSRSAEAKRKGQLAPLVAGIHRDLAYFAMPPTLLLAFIAPDLFSIIFGKDWRQAGEFAQWMAPWLYFVFITSPLSQLFSVLEKQVHSLVFQLMLLATRMCALFLGAKTGDLIFTVAIYSIGSAVCWIGFLWWVIRASGNSHATLILPTLGAFFSSLALVSPMALYFAYGHGMLYWCAALILSCILILSRYLVIFKKYR